MIDTAHPGDPLYVVTGRETVRRMIVHKIAAGSSVLYGMRPDHAAYKRLDYRHPEQLFRTRLGAELYAELLGKIHFAAKGEVWAA